MRKLFLFIALYLSIGHIALAQGTTKVEVRQAMRRVADWQVGYLNPKKYGELNWVNATFYLGLSRWAAIAEQENGDNTYYQWLMRLGNRNYWQVDQRMYHADDICISQVYLDMYQKYQRKEMLIPTRARAEWVIANPPTGSFELDYSDPTTLEHWSWCDALFMAPPVYARLYVATGEKKYIDFMDKEFKATYNYLFDKEENLFFRDCNFFQKKEANGAKVFWGRGNGWVLGGLVEILRTLPHDSKYRPFYKELFQKLCKRIAGLQNPDGFWHASLLDPDSYPSPETSCSGFFVYALAYGVNEGLLSKEEFMPTVEKGWKALVTAVGEDGKLGYVQPIGGDPRKVTAQMTEVYGPGAFLLAGAEIYRMAADAPKENKNISQSRIQEIVKMLPHKPQGMSVSYQDRAYWETMSKTRDGQKLLSEEAPGLLKKGMPPFVDSLYLDLLKSNERLAGEKMMGARTSYLYRLTLAECMENKRTYLPAIEQALTELCKQKPWSIPAHDRSLQNYNGTDYYVDLVVATDANFIAQCINMLNDRLSLEVKARVQCAFREKIFRPIYRCLEETRPFWWFTITNNWNAVCLSGVTGAALTMLNDKDERAYFIAMAEKYHVNSMKGYTEDGYCTEGVAYYNYGFREYALLREEICQATNGEIDFFHHPKFARMAQYGENMRIINGICPSYADCGTGLTTSQTLIDYCRAVLGASLEEKPADFYSPVLSLYWMDHFPYRAHKMKMTDVIKKELQKETNTLRSFYDQAGVFTARPAKNSTCKLAVSVKGGHNDEHHNHNDVGSYAVVLGKQLMLGDQGGPRSYPGDYFGRDAFEKYKCKGSFGHPVPVINGKLQSFGRSAKGEIQFCNFTEQADTISIDNTSAYPVPELESIVRTFVYNRSAKGNFDITDKFVAKAPIRFETALTTRANWKVLDKKHLLLVSGDEEMIVTIEASGNIVITTDEIAENAPAYTRIGIALKKPSVEGYVKLRMSAKE